MKKRVGYIRVSTKSQKPDRQVDGLKDLCDELHIEFVSGASKRRPVFESIIKNLRPNDTLVVWALDRAFRSAQDAAAQAEQLRARGVQFEIINLRIDTATDEGFFLYWVMCGFAEYERRILIKRTREGLAAARRRGKRLGRPAKLDGSQLVAAHDRLRAKECTVASIAREYGVAPWTLSRSLRRHGYAAV